MSARANAGGPASPKHARHWLGPASLAWVNLDWVNLDWASPGPKLSIQPQPDRLDLPRTAAETRNIVSCAKS
ncbi:hypothetical protein MCETE4_01302 [Acidimicrobiia bacterium]